MLVTRRKADPTQTLVLRAHAISQINKKFSEIQRVIRITVVEGDLIRNAQAAARGRFVFLRDGQKVDEFIRWLHEQIELEILQTSTAPDNHWLSVFIGSAYDRGVRDTRDAIGQAAVAQGLLPAATVFANPAHIERAELLFTRVFANLKGVTDTMEGQMARVLSDGILRGDGIRNIARNLNDRVEKIGKTRARLIARTEIVNAHNVAAIKEAENLEVITGKKVYMRWFHSTLENPRLDHLSWNNRIFSRKLAASRIGLPNCRCSVTATFMKPQNT